MCFSATASFTSAAILTILGIGAIKAAGRHSPLRYFAATPLFFALQQLCEGIIWLSDTHNNVHYPSIVATHIFLIIALLFWPIWIPLVAWYPETNTLRKNLLLIPLICGILFDIYTGAHMYQRGIWSKIIDGHIAYPSYGPTGQFSIITLLYIIAGLAPLFISSVRYAWLLGTTIAGSLILTMAWYPNHIASVWCFFAALLSSLIILIVRANRR